jgi:hypothetical protein
MSARGKPAPGVSTPQSQHPGAGSLIAWIRRFGGAVAYRTAAERSRPPGTAGLAPGKRSKNLQTGEGSPVRAVDGAHARRDYCRTGTCDHRAAGFCSRSWPPVSRVVRALFFHRYLVSEWEQTSSWDWPHCALSPALRLRSRCHSSFVKALMPLYRKASYRLAYCGIRLLRCRPPPTGIGTYERVQIGRSACCRCARTVRVVTKRGTGMVE